MGDWIGRCNQCDTLIEIGYCKICENNKIEKALRDQKQKIKEKLINMWGFNCKYTDTEIRDRISKVFERV